MEHPPYVLIDGFKHVLFERKSETVQEISSRAEAFYEEMNSRRSIRTFSEEWIPKETIELLIKTASSAPSGAHKQPWTFCAVSYPELKQKIRIAAEKEEQENYESRMSERWKKDLAPLGTDENKAFLEKAPWLIIVFKKVNDLAENGDKLTNYYVNESVGIACGFLIAAIHNAGLVTLTHTPSPMNFLANLLERPSHERPFLLIPVGKPAEPSYVPDIYRKELKEVACFYEKTGVN